MNTTPNPEQPQDPNAELRKKQELLRRVAGMLQELPILQSDSLQRQQEAFDRANDETRQST